MSFRAKNDTTVNRKIYKILIISDGASGQKDLRLAVREENGNFYQYQYYNGMNNNFDNEVLFLKTTAKQGESWITQNSFEKTTKTITKRIVNETINGKKYDEIIEVTTRYENRDQDFVTKQIFAKGIGLIHAYYPSTTFLHYMNEEHKISTYQIK